MSQKMSAAYTLHASRDGQPGDPAALERADLVRDGFSWGAALAPALWLAWHRHWLAALFALAAVGGLAAALWGLGARPSAIVAAEVLLHVLFGLEGASLRRLSYARRGRAAAAVVIASDLAEAEAKAFARWLEAGRAGSVPASRPASASAGDPASRAAERSRPVPIIGLFPEPEGRR